MQTLGRCNSNGGGGLSTRALSNIEKHSLAANEGPPAAVGRRIVNCPVTWRMGIFTAQPPSRALQAPWRARRAEVCFMALENNASSISLPLRRAIWGSSNDRFGRDSDRDRAEGGGQPTELATPRAVCCVSLSGKILLAGQCCCCLSWHSVSLHGVHSCPKQRKAWQTLGQASWRNRWDLGSH